MDRPIDDEAAQLFAGQFYNSLGFGLSVAQAFEQAKTYVEMEFGDTGEPKLYTAPGIDASLLYLVAPPS